jgi:hypothetical protein
VSFSFPYVYTINRFINNHESKQPRGFKPLKLKNFYQQRAKSLKIDHDCLLAHLSIELLQIFLIVCLFIYVSCFYFLFGYWIGVA